jgi:hypothetical protein
MRLQKSGSLQANAEYLYGISSCRDFKAQAKMNGTVDLFPFEESFRWVSTISKPRRLMVVSNPLLISAGRLF